MNELKAKIRRLAYQQRNAQIEKDSVSRVICDKFINQPVYRQAGTVMWYVHCRSEVRTIAALREALKRGKQCVIPYCSKDPQDNNVLGLWRLDSLAELVSGTWGILEPPQNRRGEPGREVEPTGLDLIMLPGVAFDRNGGRLGNGAGYYDRLLNRVRSDTVLSGVCYESQLFEQIPMDKHDVYMDYVITEKAVYSGQGGVSDGK